jgi:predicted glycosyltransferase
MMNAWIDMDNSPHVYLLIPFIKTLEEKKFTVHVTAREYAQTIELLNNNKVPFVKIGKHSGANKVKKIIGLLIRVLLLLKYARKKEFTLAINHGSRAHSLACKILGIPCFIGMDYEHTESKIFAACATKIWIPEMLYPASLPHIGVKKTKILTYKGIKEQFYLQDFVPDPGFKLNHAIPLDKLLLVLRPPAEMANYHDQKSEVLLEKVIENIIGRDDLYVICTPRTAQQKKKFEKYESSSFRVIDKALNGKNLAYSADIMISGGGTMNREAAFFGTQVYSIFSGLKPMLDLELQKLGLLTFIESIDDCNSILFKKKSSARNTFQKPSADHIENLINQFIHLSIPK